LPVQAGSFNLFVQQDTPGYQQMHYRLHFADSAGHPLTLLGHKQVRDGAGLDLWADTTTLYTRLLRGHVEREDAETAELVGSGVLRLNAFDLARQLTTLRAQAPTAAERAELVLRFGRLFAGKLWDVYAQNVLSSSPM
jgi:hypothetical protein